MDLRKMTEKQKHTFSFNKIFKKYLSAARRMHYSGFKVFQASTILFISLSLISLEMITSCSVVRKMAGADIDSLQFAKAREAKMYEVRRLSTENLYKRLNSNEQLENADVVIYIGEDLINKIAKQYQETSGWFDDKTSFAVRSVNISLLNGSAIASLGMLVHNTTYNVDVDMTMDCIAILDIVKNELSIKLEPFNISPDVTIHGLLASTEEIVSNLIKINLADMNNKFPPLKIPVDFTNKIEFPYSKLQIRDKINMNIFSPKRTIAYNFKLKEVLVFDKKVFVALNIEKVEVK